MTPGNHRRFNQLKEAALNLGMSEGDANFYARQSLIRENEIGQWIVVPRSTEALASNTP